ncbi:hypothetical protein [Trichormus sp. NMC-1]|uniref:hypothetical protein n=1 Tax=Trichormus sp. NMC-1 TaxID=1853259 RepID=UPI0009F62246|nr:hypothetical protein [Trichormus sp. NMC-1]
MTIVRLQVTFESLLEGIASLSLEEKHKLLEIIEEQVLEAEEDLLEEDPQILAEVSEARKAYKNGDYTTIQEYIANRSGET